MTPLVLALLFAAAVGGGAMNAVAGGGSFLTFPALLFAGVAPIEANATSATALWPGSLSSSAGYRDDIKRADRRLVLALSAAAIIGGIAGAVLLLRTPQSTFRALVPWLLLAATLVFAFGPFLTRALRKRHVHMPLWALASLQLLIAIYGGFFGGGMGIMMLAAYSAMGMEDIHMMNGIKSIMGMLLNAVAIVLFIVAGIVEWPFAIMMVAGSLAGGFLGAHYGRRVPANAMRAFIILVGSVLTAYFFLR